MPCNDCSRTETCPPCPHEEREKPSPVDCPHVGSRVVERSDAPEHWTRYRCDDCGAAWSRNWSKGGEKSEEHDFVSPAHCAGCMRAWLPPGAVPGCEGCGHPEHSGVCRELEMPGSPGDVDECGCLDDRESPLTPEEEEELPAPYLPGAAEAEEKLDLNVRPLTGSTLDADEVIDPLPPQPDRRPSYLLAYSVQGHLYEMALPGDATVAALDGRLVITHQLGPVAGICQIAPITSEESTR